MAREVGRRRRASWMLRVAELLLLETVAFAALALGSAPRWALWPIIAVALTALVLVLIGVGDVRGALALPPLAWGLVLALGICALQLVPLPSGALAWLSPPAAELRDFALAPLGLSSPRPLTLDAPSTWRELAKHLAYLAVLLSSAHLARSRRSRRLLLGGIAAVGTSVALIGFGHRLVAAKTLFGLYAFQSGEQPFLSTFGNPNHLAGFLILASTLALGLALSSERRQLAWLWGLAFVTQGVALLLCLSRAGIVCFVAAQGLLGLLLLAGRPTKTRRWKRAAAFGAATVAVGAIAASLALERILRELATASSVEKLRVSKIELWPSMTRAALTFGRAGMGRGAFELGYSRFQDKLPYNIVSHAENFVLHLWAELGSIGAAGVLGVATYGFAQLVWRQNDGRFTRVNLPQKQSSSPLDLAALAGVSGLLMHNLFDFNLELPACAVAGAMAVGCLSRTLEGEKARVAFQLSPASAAASGLILIAIAVFSLWNGRFYFSDAEASLNALAARGAPALEVRTAALPLIDRHPADYVLYDLVGRAYARKGGDAQQALAFVNRALYLRPLDMEAHVTAARSLLRLGKRSQAFSEYRLAALAGDEHALSEGARLARGLDELERLAPESPDSITAMATQLWGLQRQDESVALLVSAAQRLGDAPNVELIWTQLAALRFYRHENADALRALAEAERLNPNDAQPVMIRADVLASEGKMPEALALLEARAASQPGNLELWFALAGKRLQGGDPRGALEVLTRASPFVDTSQNRARLLSTQAEAFEALHRPAKALDAYQSAVRLWPESTGLKYAVARLCEEQNRPAEAIQALRAALAYANPSEAKRDQEWIARLEQQERKLGNPQRPVKGDEWMLEPTPESGQKSRP